MIEVINSAQNNLIKMCVSLKQKKYRDELGMFVVEGLKLVREAIDSGWLVYSCIYAESHKADSLYQELIAEIRQKNYRIVQVTDTIFSKISDTEHPQGILLMVKKQQHDAGNMLTNAENPVVVILDGIQDPGNIGTIIRTADAAGCTGVVLTKGCADIYAGKTVRATMGAIFHLPIFEGFSCHEVVTLAREYKLFVLAASLGDKSTNYYSIDFTNPVAVVFGNEANGINKQLLEHADKQIYIPILGKSESLNVSAAAAAILYEAVRQRGGACCNLSGGML